MTMWARNATGLHNLFRLTSRASMEGQLRQVARGWTRSIIAEHAEGIMATTGCPSGEVQTRLRLGQFDEALKAAAEYQDIFGKDNYFLEMMDHGLDDRAPGPRRPAARSASKLGIPPLVTNDSHYTYEARGRRRTTCCCACRPASNIADPNRFRFDGTGYYLKSADEMRAVDSSDAWQEGCRNTLLVAEQVDTAGHVRVPAT